MTEKRNSGIIAEQSLPINAVRMGVTQDATE